MEDIYTQVFSLLVALAIAASFVHFGGTTFPGMAHLFTPVLPTTGGMPVWLALAITTTAGLCVVVWVLRSAGPLGASKAELIWGFQLPVDREPFLRRRLRSLVLRSGMVTVVLGIIGAVLAWASVGGGSLSWTPLVIAVALAGPLVSALAAIGQTSSSMRGRLKAQPRPHGSRLLHTAALLLLAGAALGATWRRIPLPVSSAGLMLDPASWGLWPGVLGLIVMSVVLILTVVALRTAASAVQTLTWPDVETAGGRSLMVQAAHTSLDIQEIYRSLMRPARRGLPVHWLLPAQPARPWTVLVRAEAISWLRLDAALPLWVATIGGAALVTTVSQWSAPLLLGAITAILMLLAGDLSASAARTLSLNPYVEEVLPVGTWAAHVARTLVPCAVMTVWGLLVFGVIAAVWGHPVLVGVGVLAALGVGATATAGARRPPVDWAGATVMTDAGPVPVGVITQIAGAHVAGLVVSIPTLVALAVVGTPWIFMCLQAVQTLIAIGWSLRQQRRTS